MPADIVCFCWTEQMDVQGGYTVFFVGGFLYCLWCVVLSLADCVSLLHCMDLSKPSHAVQVGLFFQWVRSSN